MIDIWGVAGKGHLSSEIVYQDCMTGIFGLSGCSPGRVAGVDREMSTKGYK